MNMQNHIVSKREVAKAKKKQFTNFSSLQKKQKKNKEGEEV